MKAAYRIAELNIEISSLYERVHTYCSGYETVLSKESQPDIRVVITQADIDRERALSARTREKEGIANDTPSDDYLEELAVYRRISDQIPFYGGFLFHGSCIAINGGGILFTAPSGTGKSTHARLWREVYGDQVTMVNDDKPLIRIMNDGIRIYGTPWNGKHRLGNNISVPLRIICVLQRGENNSIKEVTKAENYPKLMQQVYRPMEKEALERVMCLFDIMTDSVKHYILSCNMDPEAAVTAHKMMVKDEI